MTAPRSSLRRALAPWIAAGFPVFAVLATAAPAGPPAPELISATLAGGTGNSDSYGGAVTPNGRFVGFNSSATNLVAGGSDGGYTNVFVRDRKSGTTDLASVDSDGNQGTGDSFIAGISANGRFVVFQSNVATLVPGDTNGVFDVFVHDMKTGTTTRVSETADGTEGDGDSYMYGASISANGRWVTFTSLATNLVPGDTNGNYDIFVRDLGRGTIARVSVDSGGNQGDGDSSNASISANGRFVAFDSYATNLVPGDANAQNDVFVHDLRSGATTRVSVDSSGNEGDGASSEPVVTPSGKLVAFLSDATNLVPEDTNARRDVFLHDPRSGETSRVSVDSAGQQGNGDSRTPALPSHGKFVVFWSEASTLVPGDVNGAADIFLHDLRTGETRRLSVDAGGAGGNGASVIYASSLSFNGKFLGFNSAASNFAVGDVNTNLDVFLLTLK